jgi:chitinase
MAIMTQNLGTFALILLLPAILCIDQQKNRLRGTLMVCYYTPTSYFPASQVPGDLCTHIIYAFAKVTPAGIQPLSQGDIGNYKSLVQLKKTNPNLKVVLSLQTGFQSVVSGGASTMKSFSQSAVSFLRSYGFDGVDLDWEFPAASDKNNYKMFIEILFKQTSSANMTISAALPNSPYRFNGYDVDTLSRYLDFMTAMTYDFHVYINKLDNITGYNSPLYTPKGESKFLSTSAILSYYLNVGIPASKLLIGIPLYGRSWTLASASQNTLHSPAVGKGGPSPYRHLTGIYLTPDVCLAIQNGASTVFDNINGAAYLYADKTWVSYEEVRTINLKLSWMKSNSLGGVGVWAMHLDDNAGICKSGSFPMLTAIKSGL